MMETSIAQKLQFLTVTIHGTKFNEKRDATELSRLS